MLSMGFEEDIEKILKSTNEIRQTALFSATIPPAIRSLAKKYLREPQSITIESSKRTVDSIDQRYYLVNETDKLAALTRLLEVESMTSVLIFTKTRVGSDELANQLTGRGYPAEALNGDLSQDARERVLNRFKKEQISVLVATDIAARGLDIDDISHVINFDLPYDVESYVHRIGRTGRVGKAGVAITLITPNEQWRLGRIEKFIRHQITRATIPSEAQILQHREDTLIEQVNIWLKRNRCRREQEIVNELVVAGHDPLMIAAVALKLARSEEKQRPIAEISGVQLKSAGKIRHEHVQNGSRKKYGKTKNGNGNSKISHEAGMVRLSIGTGKTQGVRPGDIVGAIASRANIPGHAIGKIFIQDHQTFVDVPEAYVTEVLDKTGTYSIRKSDHVTIQRV